MKLTLALGLCIARFFLVMATERKKTSLDNPEYLWRKSPVRFSSETTVVAFIKDKTKHNPDLRRRALRKWRKFTQKIEVGSRSFQRADKKRQFNYILGTSKNHLFQMDIADLFGDNRDRISEIKGNNNMKYILVITNSLTKFTYAYPLPNRLNASIIEALQTAFKDMKLKKYIWGPFARGASATYTASCVLSVSFGNRDEEPTRTL